MKTSILKPGFEFIFSLSLIAILGLPPVLMAQNQKDVDITIKNGDTTVNGKSIKDLSPADRQNALNDIRHLSGSIIVTDDGPKGDTSGNVYFFKRQDTINGKKERIMFRKRMWANGDHRPMMSENLVIKDSLGNVVKIGRPGMAMRFKRFNNGHEDMNFRERDFGGGAMMPMMGFERRNTQNFVYVNTDNDGISTRISFHVADASDDDLKKIPPVEGAKFEISDLTIVPEFSSGKTVMMFSLPAKTVATVDLRDGEGKLLWSDKANGGNFSKTFAIGLNGIYYLQVKQGRNVCVKRIMKEE